MKLLTFWNVAGMGLGLVGVSIIVDALPGSGSAALAQSSLAQSSAIQNSLADGISSVIDQITPDTDGPSAQSLSNLLRVGERTYEVNFDASVSSQVLSGSVIRKIANGKETLVSVVSTPSGVYSTDGLASPHVLYPGVSVVETTPVADDKFSARLDINQLSNSILSLSEINGTSPAISNQFCIVKASFVYCSWL